MGVTEAKIYDLVPGQMIKVTIADLDRVLAKYRGETYEGVFTDLSDYSDTKRAGKMVNVRAGDLRYGFHDWLIESIEVVRDAA